MQTRRIPASPRWAAMPQADARMPDFVGGPGHAAVRSRLSGLSVAIAGAGSIGLGIVDRLVRLGIRSLLVTDPARFKKESMLTHPIVTPSAIGTPKAVFAARHAGKTSPQNLVRFAVGEIQDLPLFELACCDMIIAATDTLQSELVIAALARRLGIPLVRAAVEGQTLTAQVAIYSNSSDATPCPGCSFGRQEWEQVDTAVRFSCAGSGELEDPTEREPTMSTPGLCGTAADLAVNQVLRLVLGLGQPVMDTLLTYCALGNVASVTEMRRHRDCPCDHRPFSRVRLDGKLADETAADLLTASNLGVPSDLTLAIDGFVYIERAACACGQPVRGRFVRTNGDGATCPACGRNLARSFRAHKEVTPRQLTDQGMRVPLRRLHAGSARCAIVTSSSGGILVLDERTAAA